MQATLEHTMSQLKNQSDDVVDRQLIANLIVSYFRIGRNGRSLDVLDLISKMLSFTDEQLITVGLRAPQQHIISSLLDGLVGNKNSSNNKSAGSNEAGAEGGSLAELWVSFLEAEAASPATGAGETTTTTTHIAAADNNDDDDDRKHQNKNAMTRDVRRPLSSIGVSASS